MKRMKLFAMGFGFLITAGVAGASNITNDEIAVIADDQARSTKIAMELATIKTAAQMHRYLQNSPLELSAFSGMTGVQMREFVSSLTFNDKGLTGFDPTPLRQLSPSQVYRILSLFGMQSGTSRIAASPRSDIDHDLNIAPLGIGGEFGDSDGPFLEGYRCEGQHTCRESQRAACTSNC